jgi:hypothetical protein
MQHETQATSFMDQIPEKVPVDGMGNLVVVQNADDKQSDSNSSSSISPAESPTSKVETKMEDVVFRGKKTIFSFLYYSDTLNSFFLTDFPLYEIRDFLFMYYFSQGIRFFFGLAQINSIFM